MRLSTSALTAAVVAGVLTACSGHGGDSRHAAPAALISHASTPAPRSGTDSFAHLPDLRLGSPPEPVIFVAVVHNRIGLFRAADGVLLRYLSGAASRGQKGGVRLADVDGTGRSERVWFLRSHGEGPCHLGANTGYSVSIDGGSARREGAGRGRASGLDDLAVDEQRNAIALLVTTCAPDFQQSIVIRHRERPESSIKLPVKAEAGSLDLRDGTVSFIVHPYLGDTAALYSVRVHDLSPGENSLDVATRAPDAGIGCGWTAAAWSHKGLIAARQCFRHSGNMGPTTVFLLDPQTLRPLRRGPTVSHGLGIDGLSSDDQGHLLIWQGVGGYVAGITSWTSAGRHDVAPAGRCPTIERPAGTNKCPSYPDW